MPNSLKDLVDKIADLQASLDLLDIQERELIDRHVPKEIQAMIEEIHAEFQDKRDRRKEEIESLKAAAKKAIVEEGHTVRGDFMTAVYRRGETLWDNEVLSALAQRYPEILLAKKEGKPTVSFLTRG